MDLVDAIAHAHRILDWHNGNLTEDEVPPQYMWSFGDAVEEWFEGIKIKRDRDHEDVPPDAIQSDDPRIAALKRR